MKGFFDTSVLVPVFYGDHIHHQASLALFIQFDRSTGCCGAHSPFSPVFDSTAGYSKGVKRRVATTHPKNGASRGATASPLGRDLSKIAEKIASSGIKPLNRKEVAREVSERRGGR
jgi:hypothetical protein